jgi:ABC-type sugar transport system ATPase subunit
MWRRERRRTVASMTVAIRTEGLAKYFGDTAALRPLDLEVADGEVLG